MIEASLWAGRLSIAKPPHLTIIEVLKHFSLNKYLKSPAIHCYIYSHTPPLFLELGLFNVTFCTSIESLRAYTHSTALRGGACVLINPTNTCLVQNTRFSMECPDLLQIPHLSFGLALLHIECRVVLLASSCCFCKARHMVYWYSAIDCKASVFTIFG